MCQKYVHYAIMHIIKNNDGSQNLKSRSRNPDHAILFLGSFIMRCTELVSNKVSNFTTYRQMCAL